MKLKYSNTKIPYLELDENNKLIFSTVTANKIGYKWLVFSGVSTTTETLSSGKGLKKTKKKVDVTQPISTSISIEFTGLSKSSKNGNTYLTKRYMDGLKRLFEPYIKDGIFPYENLKKFEEHINTTCDVIHETDLLDEDPSGYYEDDDEDLLGDI